MNAEAPRGAQEDHGGRADGGGDDRSGAGLLLTARDIRDLAEAAGITAGSWYANPATHVGYELIGAGMLILAGDGRGLPFDYDELERWTRVGFERGERFGKGAR